MLTSERGRKNISAMPLERILPETDGPFGEIGGHSLFPWEAMNVADELAELLGRSTLEIASVLVENFRRISALTNNRAKVGRPKIELS